MARSERLTFAAAPQHARGRSGRGKSAEGSAQVHEVVREVDDVLVVDRLSNRGHVSCVVGAPARLEVAQLFDDVVGLLPRHARNLVLALEAAEMAHRAQDFLRLLAPAIDARGIDLESDWLERLRGEVSRKVEEVLLGQSLELR